MSEEKTHEGKKALIESRLVELGVEAEWNEGHKWKPYGWSLSPLVAKRKAPRSYFSRSDGLSSEDMMRFLDGYEVAARMFCHEARGSFPRHSSVAEMTESTICVLQKIADVGGLYVQAERSMYEAPEEKPNPNRALPGANLGAVQVEGGYMSDAEVRGRIAVTVTNTADDSNGRCSHPHGFRVLKCEYFSPHNPNEPGPRSPTCAEHCIHWKRDSEPEHRFTPTAVYVQHEKGGPLEEVELDVKGQAVDINQFSTQPEDEG